jgi:hypothetical protein
MSTCGITARVRCRAIGGRLVLLISLGWATLHLWQTAQPLLGVRTSTLFSRVYTVSEVQAGLVRAPGLWIGRTVRVQGVVVGGRQWRDTRDGWTMIVQPQLIDPAGTGDLPLSRDSSGRRLRWLRGLPLLGRLLPRPQTLVWDQRATYRLELRTVAGRACPDCYEAVLLDAG